MAMENPLIGKTISLISKKNVRYLGTLYSINEQNATVALQNVRSYGTEGREESGTSFLAPTDAVHPFLLFRGCDIKDLHVHEESQTTENSNPSTQQSVPPKVEVQKVGETKAADSQPVQSTATTASAAPHTPSKQSNAQEHAKNIAVPNAEESRKTTQEKRPPSSNDNNEKPHFQIQSAGRGRGRGGRGGGGKRVAAAPGTGASLLNRTVRGTNTEKTDNSSFQNDFDFQSNLEEFQKENNDDGRDTPVAEEKEIPVKSAYDKDDFFDSISSDATDRAAGIDNRLRGRQERNLNTETFGAVALNHNDYRRRGGRAGGRGRGRSGRGGSGRYNSSPSGGGRYYNSNNNNNGGGRGRGGRGRGYRNSTGRPTLTTTTTTE